METLKLNMQAELIKLSLLFGEVELMETIADTLANQPNALKSRFSSEKWN